jgi:hypothetical protein
VTGPLFAFNREATAAELSSSTNSEYLVNLIVESDEPPAVPGFVPIHFGHPALEEAAVSIGVPYEAGMDVPVDVMITAVENELKRNGCQVVRDDDPQPFEVLARWTWPAST